MTDPITNQSMPISEQDLAAQWNQQADKHNQWDNLGIDEQLAWAQARAVAADRAHWSHPAPDPPGEGEEDAWSAVALVAQDMRARGRAEEVAGTELLKLANQRRPLPLPSSGEVEG